MARYRIRVQLIHWCELTVQADSPEEASSKVEALSPRQIMARGKAVKTSKLRKCGVAYHSTSASGTGRAVAV
jgi:hypothetical protein